MFGSLSWSEVMLPRATPALIPLFCSRHDSLLVAGVTMLATALQLREPDTWSHSWRVLLLVRSMARVLGFAKDQLVDLCLGALLHDVGKLRLPERLVGWNGVLSADERRQMQMHAAAGEWMLRALFGPGHPVLAIARHHHERHDGAGYPDGLSGARIPIGARVVAVADAYDAMISDRPYSRGRSVREAVEELEREAGSQFDPECVKLFLRTLRPRAYESSGFTTPRVALRAYAS